MTLVNLAPTPCADCGELILSRDALNRAPGLGGHVRRASPGDPHRCNVCADTIDGRTNRHRPGLSRDLITADKRIHRCPDCHAWTMTRCPIRCDQTDQAAA